MLWSKNLPDAFKRYCIGTSRDTSSLQYENDDLMLPKHGDDYGIACCVSAMRLGKQMQFFGARVNLAKCLLYAINGGRDEMSGDAGRRRPSRPVAGDVLDYDDVMAKFDDMMDWLARTYVHAMNCIHYMHDKYYYERLMMALHDRDILRTMAFGIAGLSVVRRQPVGDQAREGEADPRARTAWSSTTRSTGDFPKFGNNDPRVDDIAADLVKRFMEQLRKHPTYRGATPHPVGADHHLQRRLRQEHRQHARRPPRGRALRARRQSDARPRLARLARLLPVGRAAALRRCAGRHQLHPVGRAGRRTVSPRPRASSGVVGAFDMFFGQGGFHMNLNVLAQRDAARRDGATRRSTRSSPSASRATR